MKIQIFIYILTLHVRYNTGLIMFLTYLILLFEAFPPVYSLGNQDNFRVEIIKPWLDIYSETPIIPIKLFVDNNENISKAMKIEVVSKYIGDRSEITKENHESFTVDPLSRSNITTHTDNLFEGKWLTEIRISSSNNEVYNDSFFLDIIPFSKWVSTNAIPLTAIISSSIAILAVILQYQNSKDNQHSMRRQIQILETDAEITHERTVLELRPWINRRIEQNIAEHNIPNNLNIITLYLANYGKTPALKVKTKYQILYSIPTGIDDLGDGSLFEKIHDWKETAMGHIMPDQTFQTTYTREAKQPITIIVCEFHYEYFRTKGLYRLIIQVANRDQRDSERTILFEKSD